MKKLTAALLAASALAACGLIGLAASPALANDAAVAAHPPFRAHGINRPLNYRFPVLPRNHSFNARTHRHGWRHRHRHRFVGLPVLTGPAVIYQNGEIELPYEDDITGALPVQPVVYRVGASGACNVQRVNVPSSVRGRTTVNIWRC